MPDTHSHMLFDVHFFGVKYGETEWIHRLLIDQPWQQIFGSKHRKLMHDERAILWAEQAYGPFVALVVRGHIALDIACTSQNVRNKREY